MSALPLTVTTAGLAALVNAQNTGASGVTIASVGVSPTQIAVTAATAAIPGEIKRIGGVAGQVVADDSFYISAPDQSADTYTVRTIGLYLSNGVLLAAYSQAAPLVEKASPALVVLEAAVKLSSPVAGALEFTGGGWLNPQASETVEGVVRLATVAEASVGINPSRVVTPVGLKAATDVVVAWATGQFDALATALAGKAASVHTHALGQVDGLIAALAGKAAALHSHVMGDITGLAAALALKANRGAAETFASIWFGANQGLIYPEPDKNNLVLQTGATGAERYVRIGENGDLTALNGVVSSVHGRCWDPGNFNPADKAAAVHSHDWAQVTGRPNLAVQYQGASFSQVTTSYGDVDGILYFGNQSQGPRYLNTYNGYFSFVGAPLAVDSALVGGYAPWTSGTFDPDSRLPMTRLHGVTDPNTAPIGASSGDWNMGDGYFGWHFLTLRRASWAGGFGVQMALTDTLAQTKFRFRRNIGAGWSDWDEVWTHSAFNPATKANLSSPAFTDTPTAPTPGNGDNSTRLATTAFVQTAMAGAVSSGMVAHFATTSAPTGWLPANGAAVSRSTYAALFAAIGTTFGAGDGGSTFNLPDLRGEFIRGLDSGRGVDPGRTLGSVQASQNLAHTHEYQAGGTQELVIDAGSVTVATPSTGSVTASSGGSEARPRNMALLACIKI